MAAEFSDGQASTESVGEPTGALDHVVDAVGELMSGSAIPPPIRKNALRAFNQLCAAAIDIPVAHLEGIAAERRAETRARVKLIETGANQLAEQMSFDQEYVEAAVKKFGQRIVREQVNLDKISDATARHLAEPADAVSTAGISQEAESDPIDDDWLNNFEKEACQKSTAEMQGIFARILAGEIRKPSTFSIKTVRLLGQLDGRAARLFQKLCSLTVSLRVQGKVLDARVVSPAGNAAANSLLTYGLGFDTLNVLHEYGLIIPDYNSYLSYGQAIAVEKRVAIPITYLGAMWALVPLKEYHGGRELRLHGVALSRSGAELLTVVDVARDEQYTTALQGFFGKHNLEMTRVTTA